MKLRERYTFGWWTDGKLACAGDYPVSNQKGEYLIAQMPDKIAKEDMKVTGEDYNV